MSGPAFVALLGVIVVLAFLAEAAYERLRVPPVLVLMACGLVLGPATTLVPADRLLAVAPHFGALALLLILFEGGIDLEVKAVLKGLVPGFLLAGIGYASALGAGIAVFAAHGAAWPDAVTLALIVAPISGAIVLPLIARSGLREAIRTVLTLEAASSEVLGVLALALYAAIASRGGLGGVLAVGSLIAAAASVVVAVAAGLVWPRVLRAWRERRYVDALTFGVAMLLWGGVDLVGAPGALAVVAFGLTLSNEGWFLRKLRLPLGSSEAVARDAVDKLHTFIGELTFVVRAFFFVFLGAVVRFDRLYAGLVGACVGLVVVFGLVRWLLVGALERRGSLVLDPDERRAVWALQPRGLVSAVLAVEADHLGLGEAEAFLAAASIVIVATNLVLPLGLAKLPPRSPQGAA
jgi:cell volume regulation protein A